MLRVRKAPHPSLAAAAERALAQWEYLPTLLNCKPVEIVFHPFVSFKIETH